MQKANRNFDKYWGFIKDPLYGYIRITDFERKVIDSHPVQRLRRIRQLSGAEFVYPAANHTRFEHVLGVMQLAGVLGTNLPIGLNERERDELRIAALLHDVGHAPFSHLSEPLLIKYLGKTHEDMTSWIIADSELSDILTDEGLDSSRVSKLAVGKLPGTGEGFLNQFIRSSVDVDKMDFVVRDSYHTGAGYGHIDVFRLMYTMDVLDGNLAVDITALPTLEAFILARLESFRTIYFHRASRAVQLMLLSALEAAKDEMGILRVKTVEDYLALDDYVVWSILLGNRASSRIVRDLERRRLLKCAYEKTFFVRDELVSSIFTKDAVRSKIEEEIARKADVRVDEVHIDVPSLPSVPYHYGMEIEPAEIPVFYRARSGEKVARKVTELSKILDALRAFMNIIRVYTSSEQRDKVAHAAAQVLGDSPLSSLVSY